MGGGGVQHVQGGLLSGNVMEDSLSTLVTSQWLIRGSSSLLRPGDTIDDLEFVAPLNTEREADVLSPFMIFLSNKMYLCHAIFNQSEND